MKRRLPTAAILILISGCHDAPDPTGPSAGQAVSPEIATAATSAVPVAGYLCTMVDYGGGRVRTKLLELALHPTGTRMPYGVRWTGPDGETRRTVDCEIPRSVAAVRTANDYFNVPTVVRHWQGEPRQGGDELSIEGCVSDGFCDGYDPIVVTAEPDPYDGYDGYEPGDYGECQTATGVGSPGPSLTCETTGPGGGGPSDGGPSPDGTIADDEEADCHLGIPAQCKKRDATAHEMDVARRLVDGMLTAGICGAIARAAYDQIEHLMVWEDSVWIEQDGRLKLLLGDIRYEPYTEGSTRMAKRIDIWRRELFTSGTTLAHETLHVMNYDHEDRIVGPDGVTRSLDQTARYCARS